MLGGQMPEWQRQTGLMQESTRQVNDASVNSFCYSIRLALMRSGQLQIDQLACQSFLLFGTDNFGRVVREVGQYRSFLESPCHCLDWRCWICARRSNQHSAEGS